MAAGAGAPQEFTPTWITAAVALVLIAVSLAVERGLYLLGKTLMKRHQKSLYEALLKVKEELMLLGFIPLLLAGFQPHIQKICIPLGWKDKMLPCRRAEEEGGNIDEFAYCQRKGKVPLLSPEAMQQLDNFIFVLAITHVIFTVSIRLLGGAKINQWRHWEEQSHRRSAGYGTIPREIINVRRDPFISQRYKGIGKDSIILSWLDSFGKQFYGSVSKSDYSTMRLGFIMTHCPGNRKFDFHQYMMRVLEADFEKVVGISWYLWVFVVMFLFLNVNGWNVYFWIALLRLLLVLVIGTKLEHVICQLALDVAEKHTAIVGDVIVKPSDEHFWFGQPRIVLNLIHFIFFQNAFEIAFFFWVLTTYGFDSCMMGPVHFFVTRLVIGFAIQILCSYSTLPLYAIVTQMGSHYKKEIFHEHVQQGILGWAHMAKRRSVLRPGPTDRAMEGDLAGHSVRIEMAIQAVVEDGDAVRNAEIEQVPAS